MQHSRVENRNDNKPIAIEIDGEPLGVVIPGPEGFRFLAVRFNAFGIDGRTFATIEDVRAAVRLAGPPAAG